MHCSCNLCPTLMPKPTSLTLSTGVQWWSDFGDQWWCLQWESCFVDALRVPDTSTDAAVGIGVEAHGEDTQTNNDQKLTCKADGRSDNMPTIVGRIFNSKMHNAMTFANDFCMGLPWHLNCEQVVKKVNFPCHKNMLFEMQFCFLPICWRWARFPCCWTNLIHIKRKNCDWPFFGSDEALVKLLNRQVTLESNNWLWARTPSVFGMCVWRCLQQQLPPLQIVEGHPVWCKAKMRFFLECHKMNMLIDTQFAQWSMCSGLCNPEWDFDLTSVVTFWLQCKHVADLTNAPSQLIKSVFRKERFSGCVAKSMVPRMRVPMGWLCSAREWFVIDLHQHGLNHCSSEHSVWKAVWNKQLLLFSWLERTRHAFCCTALPTGVASRLASYLVLPVVLHVLCKSMTPD